MTNATAQLEQHTHHQFMTNDKFVFISPTMTNGESEKTQAPIDTKTMASTNNCIISTKDTPQSINQGKK